MTLTPEQIEQKVAEYRRKLEEENNPDPVERFIHRMNKAAAARPNPLAPNPKRAA